MKLEVKRRVLFRVLANIIFISVIKLKLELFPSELFEFASAFFLFDSGIFFFLGFFFHFDHAFNFGFAGYFNHCFDLLHSVVVILFLVSVLCLVVTLGTHVKFAFFVDVVCVEFVQSSFGCFGNPVSF